jgi:hypothetical protein
MSEHNSNLLSLLAKTFPQFPPQGRNGHVQIGLRAVPKRNVILVRPGGTREVEGETQIQIGDDGEWKKVPEGAILHQIGEPLPDERLDVALTLVAVWVDTNQPRGRERAGMHELPGEFARIDYKAFLHVAEASLGEERRIVVPGLQIVKD